VDCDVLNADGGTRCAAITGAWVAVALALRSQGLSAALVRQVAAVSAGIVESGEGRRGLVLDLEYEEDHRAAVDCNLVSARLVADGELELVELQGTGEGRSFSRLEALGLMDLGLRGCAALMEAQRAALA
jgi:ribonuclease PH